MATPIYTSKAELIDEEVDVKENSDRKIKHSNLLTLMNNMNKQIMHTQDECVFFLYKKYNFISRYTKFFFFYKLQGFVSNINALIYFQSANNSVYSLVLV